MVACCVSSAAALGEWLPLMGRLGKQVGWLCGLHTERGAQHTASPSACPDAAAPWSQHQQVAELHAVGMQFELWTSRPSCERAFSKRESQMQLSRPRAVRGGGV